MAQLNDRAQAEGVLALTDIVVSQALDKVDTHFATLNEKVEMQIAKLWKSRPVLSIKLGDGPEMKLTGRVFPQLPRLIKLAKLGLYSLLVGPAGCGKTTAAGQLAQSLGLQFGSVCLTAGASETWLFGRQTPTGFIEGAFAKIYREGGVFLADEMDAADANLLLSINTALSHNSIINPMNGEVLTKHKDFVFIAAANTNGKGASHVYTGRSRLDAATLDRMVIIDVDYDTKLERELCPDSDMFEFLAKVRKDLARNEQDEFVSTRAFLRSYLQLTAGIPPKEIVASLVSNWSSQAKEFSDTHFANIFTSEKLKSKKQEYFEYIEKFVGATC